MSKNIKAALKLALFPIIVFWAFSLFTQYISALSTDLYISSQSDFASGSIDSTLDINQSSGDVRLKYKTVEENNSLNYEMQNGYFYNQYSTPPIITEVSYELYLDHNTGFLYITSQLGLSVVDTNNTPYNQTDDSLIATYDYYSNPQIDSAGGMSNVFIDSERNLIYAGTTNNGLYVINNQGTKTPNDDTLVINYRTTSTPALGANNVFRAYLDNQRNLLYVGGNSAGLSVINTQGTISPLDDTIVIKYTTLTTPAIGSNTVRNVFHDINNNLIYVSTASGLSVINTQGTVAPEDDTLVIKYTTSTSPAIGGNDVRHTLLNSQNNLLYVSTSSGLSVINTQGTITAADDTLVTRYHTASSPALLSNDVTKSGLDTGNNLIFIATRSGISVINNQGTVSAADDTLERTHTISNTQAMKGNYIKDIYFNNNSETLYFASYDYLVGGGVVVLPPTDYLQKEFYIENNYFEDFASWETKEPIPSVRASHTADEINGKIYLVGGRESSSIKKNTNQEYDPVNNSWTSKTSLPAVLYNHSSAVLDSKLYIIGGISDTTKVDTVYVYDPTLNSWDTKSPLPQALSYAAASVVNGKIYVSGGVNTSSQYIDVLYEYDPQSNTWSTKQSMPKTIGYHRSASINGKLYVVGGFDGRFVINKVYAYDPLLNQWEEKSSIPEMLEKQYLTVIDDKIYLYGGLNKEFAETDSVFIYTPSDDKWEKVCNFSVKKSDGAIVIVDDNIYILGGYSYGGVYSNTVYKYPVSNLTDLYQKEAYSKITWDATTPAGTSVELFYSLDAGNTYISLGTTEGTKYLIPNLIYGLTFKALLSTTDTNISPSLDSVSISYASGEDGLFTSSSGTFISDVIDGQKAVDWYSLIPGQSIPSGTSIKYYTRSGNISTPDSSWSSWGQVNSPIISPSSRYLQIKADLASSNSSETPVLKSLLVTYNDIEEGNQEEDQEENENNTDTIYVKDGNYVNGEWVINTNRPVFEGKTYPFAHITIDIKPDLIFGETDADDEGYWSWTSPIDIPNGQYEVEILINGENYESRSLMYLNVLAENKVADTPDEDNDSSGDFSVLGRSSYVIAFVISLIIIFFIILLILFKRKKKKESEEKYN